MNESAIVKELTQYHPLSNNDLSDEQYIRLAEARLKDQTTVRAYQRCFEMTKDSDELMRCYKRKLTDYRHIIKQLEAHYSSSG